MKKKLLSIIPLFLLCLTGCGGSSFKREPMPSDTLYVKKVDNLSDDFIMGMDASAVPSLEKSGVKYYNFKGEEADVYETLSLAGINYIRVRVWNDPYDKDGGPSTEFLEYKHSFLEKRKINPKYKWSKDK